jgi:hypothetical protein
MRRVRQVTGSCAFLPSRGAHTAARRAAASAFFRCLTEAGSPREGPRMPQTYAQAQSELPAVGRF